MRVKTTKLIPAQEEILLPEVGNRYFINSVATTPTIC